MKRAPLIVVSTMTEHKGAEFRDRSTSLSFWYTRAIARAGGLPLLAPNFPEQKNLTREMVARADGVMLTGGDDLRPDLYDPALPRRIKARAGGVDPARDLFGSNSSSRRCNSANRCSQFAVDRKCSTSPSAAGW